MSRNGGLSSSKAMASRSTDTGMNPTGETELQPLVRDLIKQLGCKVPDSVLGSLSDASASSPEDLLGTALSAARRRLATEDSDAGEDTVWVTRLILAATAYPSLREPALSLCYEVAGVKEVFRLRSRREDLIELATAAREAALKQGDGDKAAYFGLVLGESLYGLGRLAEAEVVFTQTLNSNAPDERKLQLHRALGQIHYRRKRYGDALIQYTEADRYRNLATVGHVATLLRHRSKVLFRMRRYSEALQDLQEELLMRQEDETRAILKARHEIARVHHAEGRLEEARREYWLVYEAAVADSFDSFCPAPLYQLLILHLESGDIDKAEELEAKLREAVSTGADEFWIILSRLGATMVSFERGCVTEAAREMTACLEAARRAGYGQILEDALIWLRRQLQSGPRLDEGHVPQAVAPLVAATHPHLSEHKALKALRYSLQPERVRSITIELMSDSNVRHLTWSGGDWACDCDLYKSSKFCSHLAALSLYDLSRWVPNPRHIRVDRRAREQGCRYRWCHTNSGQRGRSSARFRGQLLP